MLTLIIAIYIDIQAIFGLPMSGFAYESEVYT